MAVEQDVESLMKDTDEFAVKVENELKLISTENSSGMWPKSQREELRTGSYCVTKIN